MCKEWFIIGFSDVVAFEKKSWVLFCSFMFSTACFQMLSETPVLRVNPRGISTLNLCHLKDRYVDTDERRYLFEEVNMKPQSQSWWFYDILFLLSTFSELSEVLV